MQPLTQNRKDRIFKVLLYLSFFAFVVLLIWGIYFKANKYSSVIKNYKRNLHRDLWGRFTYNLIPFDKLAKTPKSVITASTQTFWRPISACAKRIWHGSW